MERSDTFRRQLDELGFHYGRSDTNIIPIIVGEEARAMTISQRLFDKGFLVTAIRPPTVPRGQARLRIALSVRHTKEQIEKLLEALRTCW